MAPVKGFDRQKHWVSTLVLPTLEPKHFCGGGGGRNRGRGRGRGGCGGGGGGGGADLCVAHECLSSRAHSCKLIKRTGASAPALSAGLTSQKKPYACSLRRQVPGVPKCKKFTQPQGEEKDCEARPPHTHSFLRRRAQSFPSPRRWMPWIRNDIRRCTWTCLPGKPDPFTRVTTFIQEMTRSTITCRLTTTPLPTLGKDQG